MKPVPRLRFQLIVAVLVRLVLNVAHRMVYPFLPEFSRGLNVTPAALSVILSARGALGLSAPLFGVLPERVGRKRAMLIGVGVFGAAMLLAPLFPSYAVFFAAILLVTVSKYIFDPSLQAYLSERVAYKQRGLVIAFVELGWSGAFLLGVPVMGWLIARSDWRAPFWPLAGLSVVLGVALWRLFPSTPGGVATSRGFSGALLLTIFRTPHILGALSISLLVSASNEVLNAVYGVWLEQAFQLRVAALGLTTIAIGLAELGGEGVVMAVVDRVGKRRTIAVALVASALSNALLPFMAGSLPLALIGLFLVFISFEIAIVASLPLMTEQLPQARGFMMSVNVAAHGAGRMIGALAGGWLFSFGFGWNAAVSVALCLIPLAAVVWLVREHPEGH